MGETPSFQHNSSLKMGFYKGYITHSNKSTKILINNGPKNRGSFGGRGNERKKKSFSPVRLCPTRPQEALDFEELLSDLITMVRMLRPHIGLRLASALLTYGVRRSTLSLVRSDAGVDC